MTTASKIQIKATWTQKQLQEVAANTMVNNYIGVTKLFEKLTPELRQEFRVMMAGMKVNYYKSIGVKTPMDLAKAMAEFDANVFGSEVVLVGDENKVEIHYETCGCWNLMQKNACFTPAMGESLGECFKTSIELITKELGLKGHVEMTETSAVIHISK
ncbi:MAG: hypothetical protein K2X27_05460 [Candidatus Obscuribacterales bacterium]|nr:hypothetical protein [Candidatus Obscuribacterales bacterium]